MERSSIDFAQLQPSTIDIELRQAKVRIEGSADPALVRVVAGVPARMMGLANTQIWIAAGGTYSDE
jgi:hypothetical protein